MSNIHQLKTSKPVVQNDLFAHNGLGFSKFACLNISKINQCQLTDIVENFQATHILDTRKLPVFRKPDFHLPQLLSFLSKKKVNFLTMQSVSRREIDNFVKQLLRFNKSRGKTINLIIIYSDESGSNYGNYTETKKSIYEIDNFQELYLSN